MTDAATKVVQFALRLLTTALLACVAASVIMGVICMAAGPDVEPLAEMMLTTLLVTVLFGSWTMATVVIRAGRLVIIMLISGLGTLAGVGLLVWLIQVQPDIDWQKAEVISQVGVTILLPSLALVHNGALSLLATRGIVRLVKVGTMICPWVFLGCIMMLMWRDFTFPFGSWGLLFVLGPVMLVSLLLAAVGTIVVPLATVGRLSRRSLPEGAVESRVAISMDCPQCGKRHQFTAGAAKCPACRAKMFIEFEEPHCECGYLLYRLTGEVCPECGRPVPVEQRWAAAETIE
ncbi:MAG: zinc ribbon domain-containing protein [Phycisphaerales bacterium]|nr:MAG: zinc ribbon domain-containing protein [Phycisphaerales bacterium]